MTDVAAAAGVSHQTVSRVLNGHPSVSAATRRKVGEAIAKLGYRRNLAARALVTGTSHIVGVLVSNTTLSGPSRSLLAIEQIARARGYWVSMAGLQSPDPPEVAEANSHFIGLGMDGLISIAQTQAALDATVAGCRGVPTVLVTSGHAPGSAAAAYATVDVDQYGGARQAMTVLRGLGHTRIAHISGPPADLHAEARTAAWRDSLPAGADGAAAPCVAGDWSARSGYQAALALLAADDVPSAIFAGNDRMALGVLRALHERGLRVPQDISVVGFDDIEGADCSIPPLTTIRQDHDALGLAAMELLLEVIGGGPARPVKIPAELVVRASTAAPAR
jgi:DNA-binding LacI/PurR family transcriptional regulator